MTLMLICIHVYIQMHVPYRPTCMMQLLTLAASYKTHTTISANKLIYLHPIHMYISWISFIYIYIHLYIYTFIYLYICSQCVCSCMYLVHWLSVCELRVHVPWLNNMWHDSDMTRVTWLIQSETRVLPVEELVYTKTTSIRARLHSN